MGGQWILGAARKRAVWLSSPWNMGGGRPKPEEPRLREGGPNPAPLGQSPAQTPPAGRVTSAIHQAPNFQSSVYLVRPSWGQRSDLKGKNSLLHPGGESSGDCMNQARRILGP